MRYGRISHRVAVAAALFSIWFIFLDEEKDHIMISFQKLNSTLSTNKIVILQYIYLQNIIKNIIKPGNSVYTHQCSYSF